MGERVKARIVQPVHFFGPGEMPPEKMQNVLMALEIELNPLNMKQGDLFQTGYEVDTRRILQSLCERHWSDRELIPAYQYWRNRYLHSGLPKFKVPRGAVKEL